MRDVPSWAERLLTLAIIAAAVVVAIKAVTLVAGLVMGVLGFLLFTALPLAAAGWIGLMVYRMLRPKPGEDHPA